MNNWEIKRKIKRLEELKEARRFSRDLYESKDITKEIEKIKEEIITNNFTFL